MLLSIMEHTTLASFKFPASNRIFIPERNNKTTSKPRCYVSGFCNFYSYLLVFPFKLTWCQSSCRFILTTSKLRRILCCISHTIILLITTPYLVGFVVNLSKGWREPTYLLVGLTNLICYLTGIDFIYILWKKRETVLEMTNWHLATNIVHKVPLYKIGIICLCPLPTVLLDNPLAAMLNNLVIGTPSCNGYSFNTSFFNSKDNLMGLFYYPLYISLLYGHLYYLLSTGFILVSTLSIKESLVQLKKLKSFKNQNADVALYQGIKIETAIRNTMKLFNDIMSNKVLMEYILVLSFYATIFEFFEWNYQGAEYHRMHVLFYIFFTGAFWIFACEVHCLVRNYLKDWVFSYRSAYLLKSPETLKQYQISLLAIQNETDLNPACISCRCFNVTYSFIGSMFGLVITYSIIVYQMKLDKDSSSKPLFQI